MSRRFWTVIAFFLSSRLAMLRSEKKSSAGWLVLSSRPCLIAIAASVPITALVEELMA
jgi:hypothetical protein